MQMLGDMQALPYEGSKYTQEGERSGKSPMGNRALNAQPAHARTSGQFLEPVLLEARRSTSSSALCGAGMTSAVLPRVPSAARAPAVSRVLLVGGGLHGDPTSSQ